MDEKTEELRDIFMDVADDATVTESQAESPGSLAADDAGVDERIARVVARMRERFDFATALPTDDLVTLVRAFYDGADDAAVADRLDVPPATVFDARMDLHLVRDADAPVDRDVLRDRADDDVDAVAADLGVAADAVRRSRRVLAARTEARQVSQRFRAAFEDALAEAGLSTTMTESVREDGLREATEDIGSLEEDADVSF